MWIQRDRCSYLSKRNFQVKLATAPTSKHAHVQKLSPTDYLLASETWYSILHRDVLKSNLGCLQLIKQHEPIASQ
jgi:hypothetical protein